ncbi:hypothetical protein QE152_g38589 [Popillia japonica]|uniref:Uncharacterized protein n=1 Tax=Popillia japonica TaxID=7064 RepID=A0AAW1HWN6_POPJA
MNTAGINSQIIHRENNNGVILKRKDYLTKLGFELVNDYQRVRMTNLRIPSDLRVALHRIRGAPEEPLVKKQRPNKQRKLLFHGAVAMKAAVKLVLLMLKPSGQLTGTLDIGRITDPANHPFPTCMTNTAYKTSE